MRSPNVLLVALITLTSLVSASIAAAAPATPAASASPAPTSDLYRDPEGRFTIPIPTNWTAERDGSRVILHDPEGDFSVVALVVTAETAEAGLAQAVAEVDPALAAVQASVTTPPSAAGIDETIVITYDSGRQSKTLAQGYAQRVGSTVYVLIFRGSVDASVKRNSQIQVIGSGFTIASVATVDLSKQAALPLDGALLSTFDAYIAALLPRLKVPGASVAVVQNGKVVFAKGYGVKTLGGSDPVTPDTRMMIGSVTKSMTTMMMASEVDAGIVSWDEPAVTILPSFQVADPALSKTITIRNLVCACTGVPRRDLELLFNANGLTARDVVASLQDFQFFTKFGEAFQYSNQMVATGGYIAASAEPGASSDLSADYLADVQRRVLDPIGMTRTTFSIAAVESGGDYASPHGATLKGVYEPLPLATEGLLQPIAPAGSAWSTADDMARYLMTEIANGVAPDGRRVVSAANLAETWKPQVAVDAQTGYGLGWFVKETGGLKLIYHGGNTLGFTSDLAFLPEAGIGIVVLVNGQTANVFTEGVRNRLLELLYAQPTAYDQIISLALDQAAASLAAVRASVGDRVDELVAQPYLGDYANDKLGAITIALDGAGRLTLDAGEFKTGLLPAADPASGRSGYIAEDPPLAGIPFEFKSDGSVVLSVGADEYVFTKIHPAATLEASLGS